MLELAILIHLTNMKFINLILLCVFLSSCSPQKQINTDLPRYSDMGAAEDAGKVK